MANPTPKGERVSILVRVPATISARLHKADLTPDRNSWIVDAIERKLADGTRADLHRK